MLFLGSVRDTLLNAQGLVKLLESQVSEMASTIGGLGTSSVSIETTSRVRAMMEHESTSTGMSSAGASGVCSAVASSSIGASILCENRLSPNHFKVLRQMIDVSELSRNVTTSLEQCMLVMSQQEEYRLGWYTIAICIYLFDIISPTHEMDVSMELFTK